MNLPPFLTPTALSTLRLVALGCAFVAAWGGGISRPQAAHQVAVGPLHRVFQEVEAVLLLGAPDLLLQWIAGPTTDKDATIIPTQLLSAATPGPIVRDVVTVAHFANAVVHAVAVMLLMAATGHVPNGANKIGVDAKALLLPPQLSRAVGHHWRWRWWWEWRGGCRCPSGRSRATGVQWEGGEAAGILLRQVALIRSQAGQLRVGGQRVRWQTMIFCRPIILIIMVVVVVLLVLLAWHGFPHPALDGVRQADPPNPDPGPVRLGDDGVADAGGAEHRAHRLEGLPDIATLK